MWCENLFLDFGHLNIQIIPSKLYRIHLHNFAWKTHKQIHIIQGWDCVQIVFLDMVFSRCYTMNQHGQVSTHGDRSEQAEGIWNPSLGYFLFTMLPTQKVYHTLSSPQIFVLQLLSCVRLFVTPWTAARQASLSFTISQSVLKLMSIESVMPSNHLILCRRLLLMLYLYTFLSSQIFLNLSSLLISLLYFLCKALFNYHEQVSVGIISHLWIMKLPSETFCKEDLV